MQEKSVFRRGVGLAVKLVVMHPRPFAVSVVGAAIHAVGTVGSTIVLGRVTDDVVFPAFETGELPDGAALGAIMAIMAFAVLKVSGVVVRRFFANMTSERGQMSLQTKLVDRYLESPLAWHQSRQTGELLAHADTDSSVTTQLLHPLPFSLGAAFLAVLSGVAMVRIDPLMAVIALLIFPALSVLNQIYSSRVEKPAADAQATIGKVSAIAHESFEGALIIKTLGLEQSEAERFAERTDELRGYRTEVGFIRGAFEAALDALPLLGTVIVLVIGSIRISDGAITTGELVQIAALFSVLTFPMRVFGFFLEMMAPSVVANERLDNVFDETELFVDIDVETTNESPDRPKAIAPLSLTASGVRFAYPGADEVLSGIDFSVDAGEVVALVGSTGSGKSTLCYLLAGLLEPTAGQVLIDGEPLSDSGKADRLGLSVVFQEPFLFADTIKVNIDLQERHSQADIEAASRTAASHEFVSALADGYETIVGERGVTLSGGQRQRVALARALVGNPQMLILDDATSAVDSKIELQILNRLRQGLKATTLIVAQRLSTIMLADRVLYLVDGRIAAFGAHEELLSDPGYESLVRAYELAHQ